MSSATSNPTSPNATLPPQGLPPLPLIRSRDPKILTTVVKPSKKIGSENKIHQWKLSKSYSIYNLFIQRISEACVGKPTRSSHAEDSSSSSSSSSSTTTCSTTQQPPLPFKKLTQALETIDSWTDEIEPRSGPQRFGNLAFRDWGKRLEENLEKLHRELLPEHLHPYIVELSTYLGDSFGSFVRIDYGSGHELAFVAWLCYLYRLGFLFHRQEETTPTPLDGPPALDVSLDNPEAGSASGKAADEVIGQTTTLSAPNDVEERLGLEIFPLYLKVVWRLQDRYGLEPAGSHGVWGLDDYQFLPYVFGAAQLRNQSSLKPSQIVKTSLEFQPLKKTPTTTTTLQPPVPDASKTTATSSSSSSTPHVNLILSLPPEVESRLQYPSQTGGTSPPPPPLPNLYLSSLLRIQTKKRGPFHEHSPLLHDISTSVPNWVKLHQGMTKMYKAECLDKFPVVQHFYFGGVGFPWAVEEEDEVEVGTNRSSNLLSSGVVRTSNQQRLGSLSGGGVGFASVRNGGLAPVTTDRMRTSGRNFAPPPPF
ncbi:PTPA-domain-containing protein [Violaceomyces palustris]|uniref:PTPA-domain-containing protein n=1 Tax=Violaceomyces palustris TaxID=1673888 RepID=A0ACD0NR19_9BASI|nr:PTPA-domain-containing protein [Violaceomyces palustris]